ncbi:hypothetical protein M1K46_24245 [Fictibacillus sp. WQ 8-8]|uniref:hypothetical protein n=1 Tax=Fictibacillus sp. WQ 8-8 TaxID=2938788 RepID=UPI00210A1E5F|nr:hypothetical protein [Fictibacillus sp. WQ 8-8]MCQ6268688.1 hypothetical protein [Fictibacillus sp. WQ 8-8]
MHEIDKVIKAHKSVVDISDAGISIMALCFWFIIGIVLFIHIIKDRKTYKVSGFLLRILILILIILINTYLFNKISFYNLSISEDKWKTEYLKPYISSRPIHKELVLDLSQSFKKDDKIINVIYLENNQPKVHKIRMKVKDKNKKEKIIVMKVLIKNDAKDKNHLSYRTIRQSISSKYNNKVFYEPVLHISQDYKVIK